MRSFAALALVMTCSSACGRLGFSSGPGGPAGADAAGVDAMLVDAEPGDGGRVDALVDDAAPGDAASEDAFAADAGPSRPCGPVEPATLALFAFDDEDTSRVVDASGRHDGIWRPDGATPIFVEGPPGCGRALGFASMEMDHAWGRVEHHADWDTVASLELFARVRGGPFQSILSRDAGGDARDGHFNLYVGSDGRLAARIQRNGDGAAGTYLCTTAPLADDVWVHIVVNFGAPPELWVDGVRADDTAPIPLSFGTFPCGRVSAVDIAGNQNPWALGANTATGPEGSSVGINERLLGGAIDHVHLRSERVPMGR